VEAKELSMTDWNKLIFGVNTANQVTLTITLGPKKASADLLAISRDGSEQTKSYDEATRSWVITLPAGDHVLTLTLTQAQWFDGALTSTAGASVNYVYYGPYNGVDETVAWAETVAATTGDAKDPWPPPSGTPVTLATVSKDWFTDKLATLRADQNTPRGASLGFV
jgi:hypothetical protein